jgi:prophage maintenance system killer protein
MSIFQIHRNSLKEPKLNGVDLNSDELLVIHSKVLQEKKMMWEVVADFYITFIDLDNQYFTCDSNKRIEIGTGVSFFKKNYTEITASDIKNADNLDIVVDAQNIPFENNSIRAIYSIN